MSDKRVTKEEVQEYMNRFENKNTPGDGIYELCKKIELDLLNSVCDFTEKDHEDFYDLIHGNLFEYDPLAFGDDE